MSQSNITVGAMDHYYRVFMDKTYTLRSLFYLLTPEETYYEHKSPDLTLGAFNMMFSFILVEQLVFLLKYGRFNGRINDGVIFDIIQVEPAQFELLNYIYKVTSLGSAMIMLLPGFLMRKVAIVSYEWVYENLRIYDLPWNSAWTYLLAFLFIDFAYYWFHRAAHEVSVFWAAHQMHHSSEEYNLTVSFRQSVFQAYCSFYFYLPLAFFVRPSIYVVHSHLNLIYQFWLHTEAIKTVGPLEYVLNTPSHHRVHHGRNPYCIDKNYAGVFIIFDRMFGTFAAEKDDEQIAYGLIHPVESFDPIYLQTFVYKYVFGRFLNAKSWSERFSVLFKGPGWEEGSPRLGFHEKIPDVEFPVKKFDVSISPFLSLYVSIHFVFTLFFFSEFAQQLDKQPSILASGAVFLVLYNLTCFGMIFEKKTNSFLFEALRCALIVIIDMYHQNVFRQLCGESDTLYKIFKWMNIISLNLMVILALVKFFQNRKSTKQKSN